MTEIRCCDEVSRSPDLYIRPNGPLAMSNELTWRRIARRTNFFGPYETSSWRFDIRNTICMRWLCVCVCQRVILHQSCYIRTIQIERINEMFRMFLIVLWPRKTYHTKWCYCFQKLHREMRAHKHSSCLIQVNAWEWTSVKESKNWWPTTKIHRLYSKYIYNTPNNCSYAHIIKATRWI